MNPAHEPNDRTRAIVLGKASCGMPKDIIAKGLGMSPTTLRKHYRAELDKGEAAANEQVVNSLFARATGDENATAAIFWAKTRMGWSEHRPTSAETMLLQTVRSLRINPASLAEVLRLSGMSPEQRDANREIETRLKSLKEGGT